MRVSALLVGGLLLLGGAGFAQAETTTVTASLPSTFIPTGGLATSLVVDKFDVVNATLTGITFEFDGGMSGTVTISRDSSSPASARSYTATLGSTFALTFGSQTETLSVVSNSFTASLGKNDSATSGTLTGLATLTPTIGASMFSVFTGPGSLSIALNILRQNSVSPTTQLNLPMTATNNAIAELQITYIYTVTQPPNPVPAPMSLALFGIGLLGLGAIRRRL